MDESNRRILENRKKAIEILGGEKEYLEAIEQKKYNFIKKDWHLYPQPPIPR